MNRPVRFLLAAVAALFMLLPVAVQTQDQDELTWYAVEMIVFERISEMGRNAELWPVEPGLPDVAGAVELSVKGLAPQARAGESPIATGVEAAPETAAASASQTPMPRAFQLVPPAQYRLRDVWKRLARSSAYRPLLHIAWIQPGYSSENARPVHVRNNNAALGAVASRAGEDGAALPAIDELGSAPTLSSRIRVARDRSKAALDGTVRVHRARYLHVRADLLYYRPFDTDASTSIFPDKDATATLLPDSPDTALIEQLLAEEDVTPRLFRMTESRRMRSRELHYLDHPLFGVLVEAWPVELPKAPPPPQVTLPADADLEKNKNGGVQPAPLLPAPTVGGSGG